MSSRSPAAGSRAALGDLVEKDGVDRLCLFTQGDERAGARRTAAARRIFSCSREEDVAPSRPGSSRAQPLAALGLGDPEHGAQDHLERDRLHAGMQRERLAGGPAGDIALGDLA